MYVCKSSADGKCRLTGCHFYPEQQQREEAEDSDRGSGRRTRRLPPRRRRSIIAVVAIEREREAAKIGGAAGRG